MTDRELLELIATQIEALTKDVSEIKNDIYDLKEGQQRIENKLDDIESNNANRHLAIGGEIRKIKSSLSKVEIVTADNWSDIAKMKATKRHRVR